MNIIIKGRNIEVTPALREYIEKKLTRLEKFMDINDVNVTLLVEKNLHRIEVTIVVNGYILRGEEVSGNMYGSVDLVTDKMEKQMLRYKEKLQKRNKKRKTVPDLPYCADMVEEFGGEEDELVKIKRFPIKPMTLEEAVMQMNMLGHNFFVFTNSETEKVNVVYTRKDGKYGLLEPEY